MQSEILNDMEFERRIKTMGDRELAEHTAIELYNVQRRCSPCISMVHKHDNLLSRMAGGIAVLAILFVAAIAAVFTKVFGR